MKEQIPGHRDGVPETAMWTVVSSRDRWWARMQQLRGVDTDGTAAVVDAVLDAGVTFSDTARDYDEEQSESFLGFGSRVAS